MTVADMVRIASACDLKLESIRIEAPRFINEITTFIDEIPAFWHILGKNHPSLGADELFSGMYHIVFRAM